MVGQQLVFILYHHLWLIFKLKGHVWVGLNIGCELANGTWYLLVLSVVNRRVYKTWYSMGISDTGDMQSICMQDAAPNIVMLSGQRVMVRGKHSGTNCVCMIDVSTVCGWRGSVFLFTVAAGEFGFTAGPGGWLGFDVSTMVCGVGFTMHRRQDAVMERPNPLEPPSVVNPIPPIYHHSVETPWQLPSSLLQWTQYHLHAVVNTKSSADQMVLGLWRPLPLCTYFLSYLFDWFYFWCSVGHSFSLGVHVCHTVSSLLCFLGVWYLPLCHLTRLSTTLGDPSRDNKCMERELKHNFQ